MHSRKAPSSPPAVTESRPRPTWTAGCDCESREKPMASRARRTVQKSVRPRPSASPLLPSNLFFLLSGPTTSWASAEASEFKAEDSEHIAAEKIPATRYAEMNPGRWRTMKVGKISSGEWKADAEEGSIGLPWKKAKSITPIERKRLIWRRMT